MRWTCQVLIRQWQKKNCRRRRMPQGHCRASASNHSAWRQLRSGLNTAHSNWKIVGSASSIFAAASCTLSYRQQTALHLVSMILVQRSFWTCFRISLTLLVVNLGRPFTEEKGKSTVPFWGKLPFHIFRKSNRKERNLEKVEFRCAFWKILNFCVPHGFIAAMA